MTLRAMLDLECLGTGSTAAVIQIGCVLFGPDGELEHHEPFLRNVQFRSAGKHGDIDGDTVQWWMQQSSEAMSGLLHEPEPVPLPEALSRFTSWWSRERPEGPIKEVWSHATYDAVILSNAFRALGRRQPWSYRAVRDLRTLFTLRPAPKIEREGIHHNALDDCRHQIKQAVHSLRLEAI